MNKTLRRFAMIAGLIGCIAPVAVVSACRQSDRATERFTVVTSIFPMYDLARAVGGADVDLRLLTPPGTEAHTFEPTPADIITLEKADVFIYNGAHMEPWVEGILSGIKNPELLVVDASVGISLLPGQGQDGGVDPHVWLDVDNAKKQIDTIEAAFETKDAARTAGYRARADDYKRQLDDLDTLYREVLGRCGSSVIVSSGHFTFGYLAARYGLDYTSVYGLSPDAEPTPSRIASIIDLVKQEKTRYLFAEELLDPRLTESIRQETGAEILYVSSGHEVSREQFDGGITLVDIMKTNLEQFKRGLGCR